MQRCIKFILTLLLALLLSPLALVIAVITYLTLGRPILFRQHRIGHQGKTIKIYKFRSMRDTRDASGRLLPDDERTTSFGRLLRKTSLDELPQIWNILKGDLVWVGPRPILTDFHEVLAPEHSKRHDVKPGITGWAQINGRNSISINERFLLDLWYVENKSLLLDLIILFRTIPKVLLCKDVAYSEQSDYQKYFSREKQPEDNQ